MFFDFCAEIIAGGTASSAAAAEGRRLAAVVDASYQVASEPGPLAVPGALAPEPRQCLPAPGPSMCTGRYPPMLLK